MKEKVMKLWVDALRSGKYKQGRLVLKSENNEYCCLGVLCDVYAKTQKKKGFQLGDGNISFIKDIHSDEKCTAGLPNQVRKWSGIKDTLGRFQNIQQQSLYMLNDSEQYTFEQIADVIEQNYMHL